MKVVFDSSVLFSAFLKTSSATKTLIEAARRGRLQIYVSEQILEKTATALLRKVEQFDYGKNDVLEYIALLTAVAVVVDDLPATEPVCRDPDDDHVIAAAVAADADIIVTGDLDLLVVGEYAGIRIMTVRELLQAL